MKNELNFSDEVLVDAIKTYEKLLLNQKWYWFLNKYRIKKAIKFLKTQIKINK